MNEIILPIIGFLLAAVGFGLFFIQAKRNSFLSISKEKVQSSLKQIISEKETLLKDLAKSEENYRAAQDSLSEIESTVHNLKQKVASADEKTKKRINEVQEQLATASSEVDNYKEQMVALTNQLRELDQEKASIKKDILETEAKKLEAVTTELESFLEQEGIDSMVVRLNPYKEGIYKSSLLI